MGDAYASCQLTQWRNGGLVFSFQKWDPSPKNNRLNMLDIAASLFLSLSHAHTCVQDVHVSSTRREMSATFCLPQSAAGWTTPLIWQQSPHGLPHCLSFVCLSRFSAREDVDVGLDVCFCVLLGCHQKAPSIPVLSLKYEGGDGPASRRKKKKATLGASFLLCLSLLFLCLYCLRYTASVQSHVLHVKLWADLSYIWLPLVAHSAIQYTHIRQSARAVLLPVPWWVLQGALWRRDLA